MTTSWIAKSTTLCAKRGDYNGRGRGDEKTRGRGDAVSGLGLFPASPTLRVFSSALLFKAFLEIRRAHAKLKPVLKNFRLLQPDGEPFGYLLFLSTLMRGYRLISRDHLRSPLTL